MREGIAGARRPAQCVDGRRCNAGVRRKAGINPRRRQPSHCLLVEHLDAFGDVAAAGAGIEGQRIVVLLQRPDHQTLQAVRGKRSRAAAKQAGAQPDALIFRSQVEFVDLALLRQLAGAVAADRGIAGELAADLDDQHGRGAADRVGPPLAAAPVDHAVQRPVRDDAGIGAAPGHRDELRRSPRRRAARLCGYRSRVWSSFVNHSRGFRSNARRSVPAMAQPGNSLEQPRQISTTWSSSSLRSPAAAGKCSASSAPTARSP